MFERETVLYSFLLGYLKRLTADIDDAKLDWQPQPGVHSAAWILGHLAISTDYVLMNLGQKGACPKEWHKRYGPGSAELAAGESRPSLRELMTAIEQGHARVTEAVRNPDPATLAKPHPVRVLDGTPIQTVDHLIGHLLTTHAAAHIGQLSFWRRCAGLPALF
ncbi:MAG: DinB family protein [Planctomycetes bacterium]|nr:DinB family protein [Planctomycetota bacterium]